MAQHPKEQQAHRVSYLIHKGGIPDGLKILHTCDNRLCVNPAHLRLGTQAENIADAKKKGRLRSVRSFTEDEIRAVRDLKNNGATAASLARKFNVSESTIYAACARDYVEVATPIVRRTMNG